MFQEMSIIKVVIVAILGFILSIFVASYISAIAMGAFSSLGI